ncbi:protein of unknown function [Azospirillum lipoferum 4B]|uniref:Uncharacterized protein n=1 Tax=Azospirillum lipoferum (strain 4B) TaxID=862719 RepID=G7Z7S9_AZOL4|nr:protein of unknown function [Azospirillum lipoferum 4B]
MGRQEGKSWAWPFQFLWVLWIVRCRQQVWASLDVLIATLAIFAKPICGIICGQRLSLP